MKRDLSNVSREGRLFVKTILSIYVKGMINDDDYRRLESELLDVIRAERGLVLRSAKPSFVAQPSGEPT